MGRLGGAPKTAASGLPRLAKVGLHRLCRWLGCSSLAVVHT
jgi:hypothetical protein